MNPPAPVTSARRIATPFGTRSPGAPHPVLASTRSGSGFSVTVYRAGMGIFHAGLPPWLLEWGADQRIGMAVESGTYLGDSADRLARAFGQCVTIERDATLAARASARFAGRTDVEVRQGSSREVLREIVGSLQEPAFFWLDAHWSAGITAGADDPCPLMAELDVIATSSHPGTHVVAVDDMRLFGFGHDLDPKMEHFPRLVEVLNRLEQMDLATFVLDDVVVAVPQARIESFLALDGDVRQRVMLFDHWTEIEWAWRAKSLLTTGARKAAASARRLKRH